MTDTALSQAAADAGRRRRLLRLAGPRGIIAGIAIDHRDSMRAMLERRGLAGLSVDDLRQLKLRLARTLAPGATAIMLDEELGGLALETGAVPATVGLIMPLEAQGYELDGDEPMTSLMADFSPAVALRYGADACKLLVPYRPDVDVQAGRQDDLVRSTARVCHELGLPLVVEPLVFRRSTESSDRYGAAYPGLVVDAVARLRPLGADLLKLPFPLPDLADADEQSALAACRAVDEACAGTPWVLLGANAPTESFIEQVRLAGTGGASGFLAGRGIWGLALDADPEETERAAERIARPALARCREEAERHARPLPRAAGD